MNIRPNSYINTNARPSWSADSTKVAVELGSRAFVVDKEKNVLQQLGEPDRWSSAPAFDPDSNSVAFGSFGAFEGSEETGWGVYSKNLDTGETKLLGKNVYKPIYNPNGDEMMTMGTYQPGYKNRLTMVREDGTRQAPVVETGTLQNEYQFDSTGNRLVYQTYGEEKPELRILDRDWGRDHAITDGQNGEFWDRSPQWSPDDKKVLFERHGRNLEGRRMVDLYTVDVETGVEKKMELPPGKHLDPAWSPDGEKIAFISNMDGEGWFDLYTMDADGTDVEQKTDAYGDQHAPAWSPDGETLAFLSYDWFKPKEHQHTVGFIATPPPADGGQDKA